MPEPERVKVGENKPEMMWGGVALLDALGFKGI